MPGLARMDSRYDLDNVEEFGGFAQPVERSIVPRQLLPSKKTFSRKGLSASRCKAIYAAGAMSGSI